MPKGQSCCVRDCVAASHHWSGKKNENVRLFRIPKVKLVYGSQMQALTERRRRAWVAAIRRKSITFEHSPEGARVCSRHFHSGQPAYEMLETHADWAPSLHMGHEELRATKPGRYERCKKRAEQKISSQDGARQSREINVANDVDSSDGDLLHAVEGEPEPCDDNRTETETTHCTEPCDDNRTETETTHCTICLQCQHCQLTCEQIHSMEEDMNLLRIENEQLKQQVLDKTFDFDCLNRDSEKVKYYTGLPSFATLMALFGLLQPHLPQGGRRALTPSQMLLVALMRLRLSLPIQFLAYLFGVHRTTIASVFIDTVSVMYDRLSSLNLICWPDRESLRTSMPHQFVEAFGKTVAVIIDCFEVFIEKPSNLKARAETFSNYKHNNTIKYLIGITPQGVISFISNGWGGRTSDKHVTENSGFLNNLLPGDKILADRGFDIEESVGMMCAEVKIPAFTRGKCQMSAHNIEQTRKIAHLRIHVERVIGNVVNKYTLLSSTIPIHLVLKCEGEACIFLDKIVYVCCALTNMCPSVV